MLRTKVVILNWNGRGHLSRFLPSVVANTPREAEVVVADNGSTDDSLAFLRDNFPTVGIVALDKNYGYAGGYNKALEQLDADLFILLNSDVETPEGWCEPLVDYMMQNPDVAAAMPKILAYNDKERFEYAGACGGFIDGFGYPFCRGRILSTVEKDEGQYDDARDIFWASGACLAFRADVFSTCGGFDADFFAHMEEIDLCWRAASAGWRISVVPQSAVYHLGGGTLASNNPRKTYLNFRNNLAMLYKNLSSASLWWVLIARMMLDGLSAMVYLITGKPKLFTAVFSAHIDFWKMLSSLRLKRRAIRLARKARPRQIYRGSIILRYTLGNKIFKNIM